MYPCSPLTGKVKLFQPSPVQSAMGFVGFGGPRSYVRFSSAVCWHLRLLANYRCTDREQRPKPRGEAPAWLNSELRLHIPHLQQEAAMWQEQAGRAMALPWVSVLVAVPSCQPVRARGGTPNGSWGWTMFHNVQQQYLSSSLVPQFSAAISLFIFGSTVLWFWRTLSSVIAVQR